MLVQQPTYHKEASWTIQLHPPHAFLECGKAAPHISGTPRVLCEILSLGSYQRIPVDPARPAPALAALSFSACGQKHLPHPFCFRSQNIIDDTRLISTVASLLAVLSRTGEHPLLVKETSTRWTSPIFGVFMSDALNLSYSVHF